MPAISSAPITANQTSATRALTAPLQQTRFPVGANVYSHVSAAELRTLPVEQQLAFDVMKGLTDAGDLAGLRKLKAAAGVGNPGGYPAGQEAIGRQGLADVANEFEWLGMPLTAPGVQQFKGDRRLTGGASIGEITAKAYVRALDGNETLFRFQPSAEQAMNAEERTSRDVFLHLSQGHGTASVRELKGHINLGNPDVSPGARGLNNEYIGINGVRRLVEAAHAKGIRLDSEGIRAFKSSRGLGNDSNLGPTTALALARELSPNAAPAENYTWVSFRGVTVNKRTQDLVERAERLSAAAGGPSSFRVTQGSYNGGSVAASAGTHDGGGVLDIGTRDLSNAQIDRMVRALREAGFAAWSRGRGNDSMPPHIHAVAIGDRELSGTAAGQVRQYFQGTNGLSNAGADADAHVGRPVPSWAEAFRPAG